jgi:hypothetical protein
VKSLSAPWGWNCKRANDHKTIGEKWSEVLTNYVFEFRSCKVNSTDISSLFVQRCDVNRIQCRTDSSMRVMTTRPCGNDVTILGIRHWENLGDGEPISALVRHLLFLTLRICHLLNRVRHRTEMARGWYTYKKVRGNLRVPPPSLSLLLTLYLKRSKKVTYSWPFVYLYIEVKEVVLLEYNRWTSVICL